MIKKTFGCLAPGCIFLLVGGIFAAVLALIFPALPDYERVLSEGERVVGVVESVDAVQNLEINGRNPDRLTFRYGDDGAGDVILELDHPELAPGDPLEVRVLDGIAYPVGVDPLRPPWLLKMLPWGLLAIGVVALLAGLVRILFVGGLLMAVWSRSRGG